MRLKPFVLVAFVVALLGPAGMGSALAENAATIEKNARAALASLLESSEGAKAIADDATGILVFPEIIKAGLIVGGQYGEGALFKNDAVTGYYSSGAASIGLQAGAQSFGYAMFFLNEDGLKYLDESDGWEIGTAPNIVVIDKGAASKLSTSSARDNIYVFFFDQKGLMAGLGIEGTKISKITPE